jgi:hypothetical protein
VPQLPEDVVPQSADTEKESIQSLEDTVAQLKDEA